MERMQSLIGLFEEINQRFPVKGSNRNAISLNPETGTLELRVWHGKKQLALNLDDQVLDDPSRALEAPEAPENERISPVPVGEAAEVPVAEE